jgi:pre-mRNA-splicing factor RBM22/SLT11
VRKVGSRFCAFVTFAERSAAEAAADGLANKLIVKGVRLRLMWGRPQQGRQQQQLEHDPMQPIPIPAGAGSGAGAAAGGDQQYGMQPPPAAMSYPSMDPTAMGAVIPAKRAGEAAEDEASKRQRGAAAAAAPAGTGYGVVPPGYGLMPHAPPPPHMAAAMHGGMGMRPPMQMPPMPQMGMPMPPPGYGYPPPHVGMQQQQQQMRPPGMPPQHMMGLPMPQMGMPPGPRPPAAGAAVPPPRPPAPMQQQQQAGGQQQQQPAAG